MTATVKRTGYTFTGWTSIVSGIEVNISEDTTVFTTTDQTITANWSIDSYTVSFNVDGGSSVPSQTINYGGKATKPANPTKENCEFKYWELNGSEYNFQSKVTSDMTLKAKFSCSNAPIQANTNQNAVG